MKKFMDENYLLQSGAARELYHGFAKEMPIIDYHNHLPPEQIAVDQPSPVISDAAPIAPTRAEAAANRRRERFGPGNEQPDFLRRPVRRPRREAEAVAPPVPQASEEPPGE